MSVPFNVSLIGSNNKCISQVSIARKTVSDPISNSEIIALTEELYELEGPNNAYQYIIVNKSNSIPREATGGISPLAYGTRFHLLIIFI